MTDAPDGEAALRPDPVAPPPEKRMRLRYAGQCRLCGRSLEAREWAIYEKATKTVRCVECEPHQRVLTTGDDASEGVGEGPDGSERPLRRLDRSALEPAQGTGLGSAGREPALGVDRGQAAPETASGVGRAESAAVPTPETRPDHARVAAPAVGAPAEVPNHPENVAGASARREYERRRAKDETAVRDRWGKLAPVALFLREEKQTTKAWAVGAVGEEKLGAALDARRGPHWRTLHDRLMPRSRANLDHLVVAPSGIWIIDAKRYKGRPSLKVEGGLFRPVTKKLTVAGRDRTALVAGMHKQLAAVRGLVPEDIPVHGVLCFIEADWPLIGGAITIDGVRVLWPKATYALIEKADPCPAVDVAQIHHHLSSVLKPAG